MSVKYHKGKFPPGDLNWKALAGITAEASAALARYDSFLNLIPNPEILASPMMVQEAVVSSRIEGTRATVGEVLEYEAGKTDVPVATENDIHEIINYRLAVRTAEEMLDDLPLSGRIIKSAHAVLLRNVRGRYKSPGQYRTEQNWIGTKDSTIETARYVPAAPDDIAQSMAAWEAYANGQEEPKLIKAAIAHAEFESIHPFLDGNGRIGRIIIPLMLWRDGLISRPAFYLSAFFDKRNLEYQDSLLSVSQNGDWTGWCVFFLQAITEQANDNLQKARAIHSLHGELTETLLGLSGSKHSAAIVNKLFDAAVFSLSEFVQIEGVGSQTARRLVGLLEKHGDLNELYPGSGRRAKILAFPQLMRIIEGVDIA